MHSRYEEKELLALVAKGDTRAFQELFDRYRPGIWRTTMRLLQSTFRAEDVLQEIFLKIWLNREKLPEIDCFKAWVNTVTRNHIYNALRKLAHETLLMDKLDAPMLMADKGETAYEKIGLQELQGALREAVDTLTPQQKKVFQLSRLEGLKHEEIAEKLQISTETVKRHISDALRIIRVRLIRHRATFLFFSAPFFAFMCLGLHEPGL